MISIIHGSDTAASRKYFLDLKQSNKDSVLIDGPTVTLTDLVQYFEGGELFSERKDFFIENLLGKRKKSKDLDKIIEVINNNALDNNIYIWESKEITPPNIKSFAKPILKNYKLPPTLFVFLESIKPNNGKNSLQLFHKAIESADAEMVFFMLIRQIRTLLALSDPTQDQIDEVKRMAPWQEGKIRVQAKLFDREELINIYAKLFEIEKGMKTGNLNSDLLTAIDFLLLEI